MSNIDNILETIDRITAPSRAIAELMDSIIPPQIQEFYKSLSPILETVEHFNAALSPYFYEVNSSLLKLSELAREWQENRVQDVTVMADNGWYPNSHTFFYQPSVEGLELDALMIEHLEQDWSELKDDILSSCKNRVHILKNAIELHEQENYIASIPLFLAQADGICCESLKSFLFAGNTVADKLEKLESDGEIESTMLTNVFLEPLKIKNHHNSGISKSSKAAKVKAPNRNGILHGHRKHLDYGTKINSLKCFSLLCFIVYATKEVIET